jgi:hypothetical protein
MDKKMKKTEAKRRGIVPIVEVEADADADADADVGVNEELDGACTAEAVDGTAGVGGVSWTECWEPVAVAMGSLDMWRSALRTYRRAACPQGSSLRRGQKCLYRCLRGRGRYHRSVSSARTDRPVSDF